MVLGLGVQHLHSAACTAKNLQAKRYSGPSRATPRRLPAACGHKSRNRTPHKCTYPPQRWWCWPPGRAPPRRQWWCQRSPCAPAARWLHVDSKRHSAQGRVSSSNAGRCCCQRLGSATTGKQSSSMRGWGSSRAGLAYRAPSHPPSHCRACRPLLLPSRPDTPTLLRVVEQQRCLVVGGGVAHAHRPLRRTQEGPV